MLAQNGRGAYLEEGVALLLHLSRHVLGLP